MGDDLQDRQHLSNLAYQRGREDERREIVAWLRGQVAYMRRTGSPQNRVDAATWSAYFIAAHALERGEHEEQA